MRWIVRLAVLAVATVASLWLFETVQAFLAQDTCLDAGGAWREGACRH